MGFVIAVTAAALAAELKSVRARGVMETQHPATVADAGSNPVGSTLIFTSDGSVGAKSRDKLLTIVT